MTDGVFCPKCDASVAADALFCSKCGSPLGERSTPTSPWKASVPSVPKQSEAVKAGTPHQSPEYWPPVKKKGGVGVGCGIAGAVLIGIIIAASLSNSSSPPAQPASSPDPAPATAKVAEPATPADPPKPAPPPSDWTYSDQKDEMRGSTSRWATTTSENSVDLPFPYNGGVTATLQVRRRSQDGLNVFMNLEKGQIQCSDYSHEGLHVKIDNGPVKFYSCSNATSGGNETAFFDAAGTIFSRLKSSKKVVIEAQIFDAGPRQFTFKTAGLTFK